MRDDDTAWAGPLPLPPEHAAAFARLAAALGTTAPAILSAMVERVLELDRELGSHGLGGLQRWAPAGNAWTARSTTPSTMSPVDIRPSSFMWPPNRPFPWTAQECRAAVIGYQVRWRASPEDLARCLRGRWELVDGYAVLRLT